MNIGKGNNRSEEKEQICGEQKEKGKKRIQKSEVKNAGFR